MPTIALIGPPRSGKTKFVDFLHGEAFSAGYTKTSGPTCSKAILKGEETVFDIIDLGSSKFEDESTKAVLIKADLIMVFCDVSNFLSLNAIKKFLPSKLGLNSKTKIILIGSKYKAATRPISDEALRKLAESNGFNATFFIDVTDNTDASCSIKKMMDYITKNVFITTPPATLAAAGGAGATSPATTVTLASPVALTTPVAAPAPRPIHASVPTPVTSLGPELSALSGEISRYITTRKTGPEYYYGIFSWLLGGSRKNDKIHMAELLVTSIRSKSPLSENSLNPDQVIALKHGVLGGYYVRYKSLIPNPTKASTTHKLDGKK